ncbi:MAG: DEAD/DEAH box helicase family protein [Lachnospiraceae bacterium]|nr:DEAD/DEAH box helicase family protein [Lachnospiraceae bacterium]
MQAITLKTTKQIVPMIYAYTTPEIARHIGWTKIGYTEQDVDRRIAQQTHTADVEYVEQWRGTAIYDDGSGDIFRDSDFHAYLRKLNIENDRKNEWFHVSGEKSRTYFYEFKANRGVLSGEDSVIPYQFRREQADAVNKTKVYFETHENGEFLWNAKPRFGKTLSVYDLCKQMKFRNVLIVTNRPAIANSWYSDYVQFLGTESDYYFVSQVPALHGKPYVLTREEYTKKILTNGEEKGCIEFVSLQDLKGSIYFGGQYNKLAEISDDPKRGLTWDILVIDEAHEGVDTYKTDVAFEHIKRRYTLHLSGTPFKALANDKFASDAIYNWTYADEQQAKRDWIGEIATQNPYENLPRLNLFTYQMSEIIREELSQGVEIQGESEEYAFDLNVFFETRGEKFVHESSVDRFLDALTTQNKFPFSTEELRNELKHTLWLLNRVDSAKALAKKLEAHPVFGQYKIILAAGDGKLDEEDETKKSYDRVVDAINKYDKTITLSVGQLTTGITIPEWSAVLMLSNIKSPALYMQAAFRSQNPCLFKQGTQFYRKKNAYVFDFDPARTLIIYESFANDLSSETSEGRGDSDKRKENIKTLLNFFPVIGEDEQGEMVELDAEKVLSIPRKIKSQEVVRRGFMSDFLFQNISNVFHAPQEVLDIIQTFTPAQDSKGNVTITTETGEELSLNEAGEVSLEKGYVIGRSAEIFGDKIFEDIPDTVHSVIEASKVEELEENSNPLGKLKKTLHTEAVKTILETAKEQYGSDMRPADKKRLEGRMVEEADKLVDKAYLEYSIAQRTLEAEHKEQLGNCIREEQAYAVEQEFERKKQEAVQAFKETLNTSVDEFVKNAAEDVVSTIETNKKEQEKKGYEDTVRDHLRGFSRTIPSFLMAYGDENVTLATFDQIIPDYVFLEVTSITLDQFRFLRDGGFYTNANTGEEEFFEGKLFDPIVFDDSVREFLHMKKKLADYFREDNTEDIFDYIPPQKTNQIFTPKWVVKKMVDMLEEENPGCFDDPDKTFIDPYMKSGLYITEIVKRLYQSQTMKQLFPNDKERLNHIFAKQVYGLAPTEIIYRIALSYILGFTDEIAIEKHNFRQVDALKYAKEGTLEEYLTEIYGG